MNDYTPQQVINALDHLMNANIDQAMIYDVCGLSNLSPAILNQMIEQAKSYGWSA